MAIFYAPEFAGWSGAEPGLQLVDYFFTTSTLAANDCIAFAASNRYGWRLADWFIGTERLDSGATLTFNIGYINNANTALDGTFKSAWAGGQGASGDFYRATEQGFLVPDWDGRKIGVHCSAAATSWIGTTAKRMTMGLHWVSF
jgi:hypothetical protein